MTRVSENSSYHALNHSVGKSKSKLEDLQIKGSNLKRIQKPSDDPIGNIELLAVRSRNIDNEQYMKNSNYAKTQLSYTEAALDEIYEILVKAKEISISQASNIYNPEVRQSISKEIGQLHKQSISVGNRRLGNRYLFSGYKTLTRPFDEVGNYQGDAGKTSLEIAKDVYVPVNFDGMSMFYQKNGTQDNNTNPLKDAHLDKNQTIDPVENRLENPKMSPEKMESDDQSDVKFNRGLASVDQSLAQESEPIRSSLFSDLKSLETALITNNHEIIQVILPKLDDYISQNVEARAKIGSIINSVENSEENLGKNKVLNAEYKTSIEDADVAELFSDLSRQQNVMTATYKTNANLISKKLLDFL